MSTKRESKRRRPLTAAELAEMHVTVQRLITRIRRHERTLPEGSAERIRVRRDVLYPAIGLRRDIKDAAKARRLPA